jgi:hypothetical protein
MKKRGMDEKEKEGVEIRGRRNGGRVRGEAEEQSEKKQE